MLLAVAGSAAACTLTFRPHTGTFRGTTTNGGHVKLVVSARGRRVAPLDFGSVTTRCPDGSTPREPLETNGSRFRIDRHGRFRGDNFLTSGNGYMVSGSFVRGGRARGTVAIITRTDCFGKLRWTARLVRPR